MYKLGNAAKGAVDTLKIGPKIKKNAGSFAKDADLMHR